MHELQNRLVFVHNDGSVMMSSDVFTYCSEVLWGSQVGIWRNWWRKYVLDVLVTSEPLSRTQHSFCFWFHCWNSFSLPLPILDGQFVYNTWGQCLLRNAPINTQVHPRRPIMIQLFFKTWQIILFLICHFIVDHRAPKITDHFSIFHVRTRRSFVELFRDFLQVPIVNNGHKTSIILGDG